MPERRPGASAAQLAAPPLHASRLARANACYRSGDVPRAHALWNEILACAPHHAAARINLSMHLRTLGDWHGAAECARAGLAHRPRCAPLWLALAQALLVGQRDDLALLAADAALELDDGLAEAWLIRGTALGHRGDVPAALASLQHCLRLAPGSARAELHLGNVLIDLDRIEDAAPHLRRAVALQPDLIEAHVSLGFLEASRHHLDAAIASYRRALALQPDHAAAHSNLAAALLLSGDYQRGFAEYEWRRADVASAAAYWRSDRPEWAGEALRDRTILVFCEQGLGDTIMCARYLKLLADRGASIVLVCPSPLIRLLRGLAGIGAVVAKGDPAAGALVAPGAPIPDHDCWINQLSLPRLFDTRPDQVPCREGYLSPDALLVRQWRARLPAGPKVGLVWAGNPLHGNDHRRSIPLPMLRPLLAVPGISFIGLQHRPPGSPAAAADLHDVGALLTDYAQTAALVASLDLVIAVDTSVAHLAGALGVPCWVLLPFAPEWRWMLGRSDSAWYASLRLFRQSSAGDWHGALARVATALRAWLAESSAKPCLSSMATSRTHAPDAQCHAVDTQPARP